MERNLAVLIFSIHIFFERFLTAADLRAAPPKVSSPE